MIHPAGDRRSRMKDAGRWKPDIRPGDWILVVFLALALIVSLLKWNTGRTAGSVVYVRAGGRLAYSLDIRKDADVRIPGPVGDTVIRIKDGWVYVLKASCPHELCKHMGRIRHAGEVIYCLPNRVLITVEGREPRELDGITM